MVVFEPRASHRAVSSPARPSEKVLLRGVLCLYVACAVRFSKTGWKSGFKSA